jgi:hypothetical protein
MCLVVEIDRTYHAQSADKLFGWLNTGCDDHLNEVGADTDDQDHADSLKDASAEEHLAQRHGVVAGDRHFGWLKVGVVEGR